MFIKKISIILFVIFIISCSNENNIIHESPLNVDEPREITILYTNDEHGWIEKSQYSNGAANIMGRWENVEGYDGDDSYLILSGGDSWLGPPISNLFQGESVVDVMNKMEYDAVAIGNHEFEFGVQNLYNRTEQANFDFLSCNIRKKSTGKIPPFARPYIIKDINNIRVGIIGLTTIATPNMTVTEHVSDYDFINYLIALEEIVPKVIEDGAELLIVAAHVCYLELISLAPELIDLGISVVGGGHCHRDATPEIISTNNGEIAVIQANPYYESYSRVDIKFDIIDKEVISLNIDNYLNETSEPDHNVEDAVHNWQIQANLLE